MDDVSKPRTYGDVVAESLGRNAGAMIIGAAIIIAALFVVMWPTRIGRYVMTKNELVFDTRTGDVWTLKSGESHLSLVAGLPKR